MFTIELWGGPLDGSTHTVDKYVLDFGYLRVMSSTNSIKWYQAASETEQIKTDILIYKRQKYLPGWACIAQDWDDVVKAVHTCHPLEKWVFVA
jgi:hypothetical protein